MTANIMCACEECTITTKKISNSYQQCVPRYKLNGKRNSIGKYNQLGKFIHKLLKRGKKVTKSTHFTFTLQTCTWYLEAPHKRMPHCKIMKQKIEKQKRKQQE